MTVMDVTETHNEKAEKLNGRLAMLGVSWLLSVPTHNWSTHSWNLVMAKPGLYANIHAKRKRIAAGSGERCANLAARVLVANCQRILNVLRLQRKSKPYLLIMKSIIASGLLLGMAHGSGCCWSLPANVEANSG